MPLCIRMQQLLANSSRLFEHILPLQKFHDDTSNGSRVITLTNQHIPTDRHDWKQYHLRYAVTAWTVNTANLSDLCVPTTAISGRQRLRSAAPGTLLVPRAQTVTGQRSFAINWPATWNYGHQTCRKAHSSRHWKRTCSRPPGAIETSSWFWRRI